MREDAADSMRQIDLHTHSTRSDGTLTPAELIEAAARIGLTAIALTDHDTVDGLEEAAAAGEKCGVRVIPGIEMSISGPVMVHMIGLGIDGKNAPFREKLEELKRRRTVRNLAMMQKLIENGFSVSMDDLPDDAGKSVTRAHIGKALVQHGYAATIKEACNRYLLKGCIGYVPSSRYSARECIDLIHMVGGKSILCHINQIKLPPEGLDALVEELVGYGLDGIETLYSEYDDAWRARAEGFAARYGLLRSGGSDFHGANKDIALGVGYGDLFVPESFWSEIEKRL